jgi:two-component system sensor histidine kinase RegB
MSLMRNGLAYGAVKLSVFHEGPTVSFCVTDIGPGIPSQIIPRLGEPFFTTKGPGKGMGLGLFITKTFANRIGGRLHFESSSAEGTVATLSIPEGL